MDFVNELRKRGKRITNAREVVCKILETSGHKHFTVEELHKLSLKKDKNIDLATVYRTLELLENINLIEATEAKVIYPDQFIIIPLYQMLDPQHHQDQEQYRIRKSVQDLLQQSRHPCLQAAHFPQALWIEV